MSDITQKIDSIISTRQTKLPEIIASIERLDKTFDVVKGIESIQKDLESGESRYKALLGSLEASAKLKTISLKPFYKAYSEYRQRLLALKSRFEREHLHISLVGSARQGKSLVIQNISGLDKSIIPSSDGNDCTGAKSIITNADNDNIEARITFYTEPEICEIVNRYLNTICEEKKYSIFSIDQFSTIPVDEIKKSIGRQAEAQQLLKHLKNYIEHIPEIRNMLGSTITIPKEDIESYVAQYKHDDFGTKYWKYLGVKSADIRCRFPYSDAGKIVLLDTIGIGTTSLGVEDSMLKTVEEDSDAIVFMFRPDSLGPRLSSTEISVIDKISDRVSEEYAQEMLFWVINRVEEGKGRNIDYISGVIEQIQDADYPVSEILQVNCLKQDEVERKLLVPILSKISRKINDVDRLLADRARNSAISVYDAFMKISGAFDDVRCKAVSQDIIDEMLPTISDTYEILLNTLRDLYITKYNKLRSEPCAELKTATENTLRRMFKFVPSEADILELLNKGTLTQHNAIEKSTNRIRLEIIDAFNALDLTLSDLVNKMKVEVLSIFAGIDKGRLSTIGGDVKDPVEWIDHFIDRIKGETDYPIITTALRTFRDFHCSVQGFMIYEIRNKLDRIDYSIQQQQPKLRNGLDNKPKLAREIYTILTNEIEEVHNNIENSLNTLYKIPNRAMFAAIKDLYDRCAFEDRKDKSPLPVTIEWQRLYRKWAPEVWREEYSAKQSAHEIAGEFNNLADSIAKCSNKANFEIRI